MPKVPYMTKRHFIVLADELAHNKFYYNSQIAYHEQYARLTEYCQKSNDKFNLITFNKRIDDTYKRVKLVAEKSVGGTDA